MEKESMGGHHGGEEKNNHGMIKMKYGGTWLAQLIESMTFDFKVVNSSPMLCTALFKKKKN